MSIDTGSGAVGSDSGTVACVDIDVAVGLLPDPADGPAMAAEAAEAADAAGTPSCTDGPVAGKACSVTEAPGGGRARCSRQ